MDRVFLSQWSSFLRGGGNKDEYDEFEEIGKKLQDQYEQGEISALEWNRNRNQLYQFYTALVNEENDWLEATRQLQELLLINTDIKPVDTVLQPRLILPDSALASILIEPASKAVTVEEKNRLTERSAFFPSVNAGYFNQKIESDVGLQGFFVGLRVPLWFVPQSARVKLARIESEKRMNEYRALEKRYDVILQTQWRTYKNYKLRWQESINEALESSNELKKLAEEAYLNGEISYLNFGQSVETALDLKFTYLDNLYRMNISALKLEYLVKAE